MYDWSIFPEPEDPSIFNQYIDFIEDIFSSGRPNIRIKGETAKHHILPSCLGGSDGPPNRLHLYYSEHFIAHRLLSLSYSSNRDLAYAFMNMCKDGRVETTPETYAESVRIFSKCQSDYMKEHSPFKDRPKTEAQIKASKYERTPEIRKKISIGVKESFKNPTAAMIAANKKRGFASRPDLLKNRRYHPRVCPICNQDYEPTSSRQYLCPTHECRRIASELLKSIIYL